MRRRLLAAFFGLALSALPAFDELPAQAQQARVVTACGSLAPFGPDAVGGVAFPTIDTTGKLCLSGGGGGGSLVGGTTPVTGTCPSGQFLYNNAGVLGCSASSTSIVLPQTVSGTVNSGGVAYFNSTTQMSSSALLAANALMVGGGAGVAPSTITTGAGVNAVLGVAPNTNGGIGTATTASLVAGSIEIGSGSGVAPTGLADVATGSYLKSGGVNTNPAYQAFGAGVQAAVALNANAAGGVALVSAVPTAGNYVKWAAGGLVDGGAGSGGGTITAGSTPTSGISAGYLLMSDGSLVQSANNASVANNLYASSFNGNTFITGGQQVTGGFLGDGSWDIMPAASPWTVSVASYGAPTTASAFRVYNTFTDISNGEWGALDWRTTANVLTIGSVKNGTGTLRPVQISGSNFQVPSLTSVGTKPTVTGSGGTCAAGTTVGGALAGTFQTSAVCAAGNTIALTGMPATATGYACDATDRTLPAALIQQTASTTTGATFTVAGTSTAASNVISWKCMGY
jgi:hypothetical protein